jgi:hypothetical protein
MPIQRLAGIYRGIVLGNSDPLQMGRVQLTVPSLAKMQPSWALPAIPYASGSPIPAVNSAVFVEFEEGNLHYPVWLNSHSAAPRGVLSAAPIRWLHGGEHFSRMRRTKNPTPSLFIRM